MVWWVWHSSCVDSALTIPVAKLALLSSGSARPLGYPKAETLWWSLEWDRRPTTTRPGSGAGLAVVARADWLQGHATETAKMRQREERERALSMECRDAWEERNMNWRVYNNKCIIDVRVCIIIGHVTDSIHSTVQIPVTVTLQWCTRAGWSWCRIGTLITPIQEGPTDPSLPWLPVHEGLPTRRERVGAGTGPADSADTDSGSFCGHNLRSLRYIRQKRWSRRWRGKVTKLLYTRERVY